jgi:hypothetical protein
MVRPSDYYRQTRILSLFDFLTTSQPLAQRLVLSLIAKPFLEVVNPSNPSVIGRVSVTSLVLGMAAP